MAEHSYLVGTDLLSEGFVFWFDQSAYIYPFLLLYVVFLTGDVPCVLDWIVASEGIDFVLVVDYCKIYLFLGHLQ